MLLKQLLFLKRTFAVKIELKNAFMKLHLFLFISRILCKCIIYVLGAEKLNYIHIFAGHVFYHANDF